MKLGRAWGVLVFLVMMLGGCGGGGGSTTNSNTPVASQTVSGVAAVGTPISGTVYLKDSSNPAKEISTSINTDGSFSFDVAGLTAPFLLKAVGTANGQNYTLYSFAGAPGVANINPLSHIAVVQANNGTDPAALYSQPTAAQLQALRTAIAAIIPEIQTLFQQILSQYGVATTNFITDGYTANHTGFDLLFDMVSFIVSNGTLSVSNKISGAAILTTTLTGNTLSGEIITANLPTAPTQTVGAVFVYPPTVSVAVGGSATFKAFIIGTANQSVTWSVVDAGGGSITSTGVYTAPSAAGTYHVKATSTADTSKSSTATVTVTEAAPTPVSGLLGGTIQNAALSLTGTTSNFAQSNQFINGLITDGTNLYFTSGSSICMANLSTGLTSTIAGVANVDGSVDGIGSAAKFYGPYDLTIVGANLYVLDGNNYTIRKIEISTGKVTTFAGKVGISGHTDGVGTAATFGEAFGITNDGSNLYVVDESVIRKIEISTGIVSTVAGKAGVTGHADGIGSTALFNQPIGITTDGSNLYVADSNWATNSGYFMAGTIRKIVISTGQVSTIAGSATVAGNADGAGLTATFNYPSSITTDGTNLYITQQGGGIRKLSISSGQVSTLIPSAYYSGITTDGKYLYAGSFAAANTWYIVQIR